MAVLDYVLQYELASVFLEVEARSKLTWIRSGVRFERWALFLDGLKLDYNWILLFFSIEQP